MRFCLVLSCSCFGFGWLSAFRPNSIKKSSADIYPRVCLAPHALVMCSHSISQWGLQTALAAAATFATSATDALLS